MEIRAERIREILTEALTAQYNKLDDKDINFNFYAKEIQAVALRNGLTNLYKDIENDL